MGCGIMFPRDYILDSEGESDDSSDMKEMRLQPRGVRNVMYLRREQQQDEDGEEEDEEEEEDIERDHEGRKVVVFFTRNGKIIGKKESILPQGGFYPTIGMLSSGEKVKVDLHPLSG